MIIKFKAIDTKISSTSGLVTKTQYDLDKQSLEKKTEDVEKTLILISWSRTLIATQKRIEIEIENKIHSVTGKLLLLCAQIENKIFNITNLAKKDALNIKVAEVESKIPDVLI